MCHRIELAIGDSVKYQSEINHMQIFMDKFYILYSTSPSRQRGLESCSEDLCDVIRIGRVLGTRWCASSLRALQAIWQNYPTLAKNFADNITPPPPIRWFAQNPNIFNVLEECCSYLMLDAFGEVSELSLALQSESTTLSKAYKLVKRCIRALAQFTEGHSGEHTKTAEELCAAGVHRYLVRTTSYSKVKIVNHDRFYQSF